MSLLASTGPSPLWYLTRGTGLVALVLLTFTVVLGVLTTSRWQQPGWPRFATVGLHRNVSLLTVMFLAIHIITAELDTFAPVGWLATLVPFASPYRPLWLGLGTVAFDLLLAVVVTSLIRTRLGFRVWKAVHWLAYLSWPVALLHGLGTGTDARVGMIQLLDVACLVAVLAALVARLARASHPQAKVAGGAAVALVMLGSALWAASGPLRPGWARRAGTPAGLLATTRTASGSSAGPAGSSGPSSQTGAAAPTTNGLPATPFEAAIAGTVHQAGPDASGQVTITIDTRVSGAMTGSLSIVLRGQSAGAGVALASSSVTFGPSTAPTAYRGAVVSLEGDQVVAQVSDASGARIDLGILLQINPSSGQVTGTVNAGRGGLQSSRGGDDSGGGR